MHMYVIGFVRRCLVPPNIVAYLEIHIYSFIYYILRILRAGCMQFSTNLQLFMVIQWIHSSLHDQ